MADTDTKIYRKKRQAFRGCIKCPLELLQHEDVGVDPRELDAKNVTRLVEIFKLEGCRRLEVEHHIPASISRDEFGGLNRQIGGRIKENSEPLPVKPSRNLTYLHGKHRIGAARQYLHPDDKWWVVDLYVDLGEAEVNELRQEYSNARNFYDGDIYRHLRCAALAGNIDAKKRWLAKLSITKRRDICCLEKRAEKDPQTSHLLNSLDTLVPFPGLWPAFQAGTLHRILAMRCPEEMTRYVTRIQNTWNRITIQREEVRRVLDAKTVSVLQGRCPKYRGDSDLIRAEWKDVFSRLSAHKATIWTEIAKIDYIIPSIHTFLEDTKLLEPPARIMKTLLPSPCKTTILREFELMHNGSTEWLLQTTETISEPQDEASSAAARHNAYRQLWLYAIRHFPAMTGQPLRKDPGKMKPPRPALELIWWNRFTQLALNCGYTGIDRKYVNDDDVDHEMVKAFLQQVRPHQIYTGNMQNEVQDLVQYIKHIRYVGVGEIGEDAEMQDQEHVGAIGVPCGSDITFRCGVPFDTAFKEDQAALFLPLVDSSQTYGEQIRSFAVKRDIFHSFFGLPEDPNHLDPQNQPDPQPSPMVNTAGNETLQLQANPPVLPVSSGPPPRPPEVPFIEPNQFSATRSLDQELFPEERHITQDEGRYIAQEEVGYLTQEEAVHMLLTYQQDPESLLVLEEVSEDRFRSYRINYDELQQKLPKYEDDCNWYTLEEFKKGMHYEERAGKRIKRRQPRLLPPAMTQARGVLFVARRSSKIQKKINEALEQEALEQEQL